MKETQHREAVQWLFFQQLLKFQLSIVCQRWISFPAIRHQWKHISSPTGLSVAQSVWHAETLTASSVEAEVPRWRSSPRRSTTWGPPRWRETRWISTCSGDAWCWSRMWRRSEAPPPGTSASSTTCRASTPIGWWSWVSPATSLGIRLVAQVVNADSKLYQNKGTIDVPFFVKMETVATFNPLKTSTYPSCVMRLTQ